jgi:hypothetical protein
MREPGEEILDGHHDTRDLSIRARLISRTAPRRSLVIPDGDNRATPRIYANRRESAHALPTRDSLIWFAVALVSLAALFSDHALPDRRIIGNSCQRQAFKESSTELAASPLPPAVSAGVFGEALAACADDTRIPVRRVKAPERMAQWMNDWRSILGPPYGEGEK